MIEDAHRQADHLVRFDWGPTGAAAISADAAYAVVVDVLSFTTTLTVAVERGMTVFPYRWRDDGAADYARARDAVLAVGRFEILAVPASDPDQPAESSHPRRHAAESAADVPGRRGLGVSLSPAAMGRVVGVERIVLPSPNGSTIAYGLQGSGARVVGGCLRNAAAVAGWLAPRLASGGTLAVVAAGERWPDGSLRPAAEDLWGAGAVLAACAAAGLTGFSPEADAAAQSFRAVVDRLPAALSGCASGRELIAAGFGADVAVAAAHEVSTVVPVLDGEAFVPAT
ncbi:2-phosphosulfolactate phosphatase [Microlunatus speluncae]|uniref:2-phosphosulfolactate phosphatase n=1 Tax=Microlunatus speluncae TaxID=2594267 RepID=UPI001FE65344|nr:2-phosphosulfolactate phosphatase [Microlunatus speluncae]